MFRSEKDRRILRSAWRAQLLAKCPLIKSHVLTWVARGISRITPYSMVPPPPSKMDFYKPFRQSLKKKILHSRQLHRDGICPWLEANSSLPERRCPSLPARVQVPRTDQTVPVNHWEAEHRLSSNTGTLGRRRSQKSNHQVFSEQTAQHCKPGDLIN